LYAKDSFLFPYFSFDIQRVWCSDEDMRNLLMNTSIVEWFSVNELPIILAYFDGVGSKQG